MSHVAGDVYQKPPLLPCRRCATRSGCASTQAAGGAPPVLVSGAGHDAMVFAEVTKMGMLFVRCK